MQIIIDKIDLVEMTDDLYFSEKYKDYVSNSRLSLLNPCEGGSVEKFKEGFKGGFKPSFVTGTAIHELALQPNLFHLAPDLSKPTAKVGAIADLLYNTYIDKKTIDKEDCEKACIEMDYYSNSLSQKRIDSVYEQVLPYLENRFNYESTLILETKPIYLDSNNIDRVFESVAKIQMNKEIQDLLKPTCIGGELLCRNEDAIIAEIRLVDKDGREYPLKVKQKMDNFTYDPVINELVLNDLKSTGRFLDQFHESFYKYRYFRQIGMYTWFLLKYIEQAYDNTDGLVIKANILLTCTIPDFRSGVFKISNHQMRHGVWAFKEMFKLLMENYDELYSNS